MPAINNFIHIFSASSKIYDLLSTKAGIRRWLKKSEGWDVIGDTNLGGSIHFHFGELIYHEMNVTCSSPNLKVEWQCTGGPPEWIGTTVELSIINHSERCSLIFAHKGWGNRSEAYYLSCREWHRRLISIKAAAETN